jgi:hypothetical protein
MLLCGYVVELGSKALEDQNLKAQRGACMKKRNETLRQEESGKDSKEREVANKEGTIIIRDRGQPLELHRRIINGVEVYTPTEEKTKELKERFREMVPPPEPTSPKRSR